MTEPGEVLAGRYRLVEPLGEGGMGTVWRAEHIELGSEVAVKLIAEGIATSETALGRFKREAKAAAALSCPNVVQIFDYGVDKNLPYIAMELLKGESLAHRIKKLRMLPAEQIARLLTQVGRALDKAHKAGILHRDIKPDNIFMCSSEDDEEVVKVLDFGVAKALKPDVVGNVSSHTRTGALVGSPFYMSPEQIRGQKTIDHRADLWSIGVIAYECLLGKRPFEGESLGDLVMTVCSDPIPVPSEHHCKIAAFDGWFAKACARDPNARYQNAKDMAKEFRALIGQVTLDEETRDSVVDTPAAVPTAGPAASAAAVAAAAAAISEASAVPTAAGLARTQDGPTDAARSSVGKKIAVAAGLGVLVAGVAVASILIPWSGSGASGAAASSTASAETTRPTAAPSASAPRSSAAPLESAPPAPSSSAASTASAAPAASGPRKAKSASAVEPQATGSPATDIATHR